MIISKFSSFLLLFDLSGPFWPNIEICLKLKNENVKFDGQKTIFDQNKNSKFVISSIYLKWSSKS